MTVSLLDKINTFQSLPRKRVCLTAYTSLIAELLAPHVDLLLVGDSMGNVLYGLDSTQGVSIDYMIAHGKAVRRGAPDALVVVDMPYGTYEDDKNKALANARLIIDETACDALKLEGGADMAPIIAHLVSAGIPVMGHIGLMPQSAPDEGGFKIKGKTPEQTQKLADDIIAIEQAGVFASVLEGTIESAARNVIAAAKRPVIGIGASIECDGQILVTEDMLGLTTGRTPKFVKHYADLKGNIQSAVQNYANDVRSEKFPSKEYVYENR